jgi:hypothetical protein
MKPEAIARAARYLEQARRHNMRTDGLPDEDRPNDAEVVFT